jgi:hypothetical protein
MFDEIFRLNFLFFSFKLIMVWFSFLFLSFQSKNLCYSSMLAWFGFSVFYWLTTCLEKTVDNLNKKLEKWKKSILVFHVTLWLCVHPVLAFHLIQNTWIRTPILFNCESLWFLAKIICLKVEGSFIFMKNILRTYYILKRTLVNDFFQFHSCFDDCFCFSFEMYVHVSIPCFRQVGAGDDVTLSPSTSTSGSGSSHSWKAYFVYQVWWYF